MEIEISRWGAWAHTTNPQSGKRVSVLVHSTDSKGITLDVFTTGNDSESVGVRSISIPWSEFSALENLEEGKENG